MAESESSDNLLLLDLEDELTCSICLCPFDCPVTIPCGHNFCQDCIFATWKNTYSCPQCRTHFATKPELKKNTVLSSVVEALKMKSNKSESSPPADEVKVEKQSVLLCDTCMESKAVKTCLTCMASYCEEHVRPHRENPNFLVHQLCEPLLDLRERICPDHYKLMEFFCVQHGRCICSFCLQQVHKGCTFSTPDEQRGLKESDLRDKLGLLDGKIEKNKTVLSQISDMQNKLKDSAANRKRTLEVEYRQMREMLEREEREALNAVDREQESSQTKIKGLQKKFTQNVDQMSDAKDCINSLLDQSQTLAFLQASVDLPSVVAFEPYTPRINLDTKVVTATQAFAAILKEHLADLFKQPVEARLQMLKPGERTVPLSGFSVFSPGKNIFPMFAEVPSLLGQPKHLRSPSPGAPLKAGQNKKQQKQTRKPPQAPRENIESLKLARSMENLLNLNLKKDNPRGRPPAAEPRETPETSSIPPNITAVGKRHDLLKYGTVLTLDPKTAHKRIKLSDDLTTASVSDEATNCPEGPARFSVCTQVLASKGFSRGRHYWEVKMSSNNYIGIGLSYNSIDRKGPSSRLGRNGQSWCVEWFNIKLSAWHASSETVLPNPNPKRVGVLLDCEEGTATFYNVADRMYPFHTFVFPFAEAVYPAFWIFSSGASVSLCKLQA
ncbi:E3 ubiquitin/ISG15 ligase TRIM25 isoform 2-T3 [Polymixia lowei]